MNFIIKLAFMAVVVLAIVLVSSTMTSQAQSVNSAVSVTVPTKRTLSGTHLTMPVGQNDGVVEVNAMAFRNTRTKCIYVAFENDKNVIEYCPDNKEVKITPNAIDED